MAGSADLQREFLKQARGRTLRQLHRSFPHGRSGWLEEAWADTLTDLIAGKISGFVCTEPVRSAAFLDALSRYLAFHIAPKKLVDILRREGREPLLGDLDEGSQAQDTAAPDAATEPLLERLLQQAHTTAPGHVDWMADPTVQRHLVDLLHRCIAGLSAPLRAVIHAVLHEQPHETTRERLGLKSVGTVKSRLFAAMADLRRCMGVHLPHGGMRDGDPPGATCAVDGETS